MSTISQQPPRVAPERSHVLRALRVRELWASVAIVAMWVAVLVDAVYGSDITVVRPPTTTSVPAAVVLGLFAMFATIAIVIGLYGDSDRDPGQ